MARQITDAFPWNDAPDHIIRDRDSSYGHAVTNRLAAMGIRDQPTAPRSPWQPRHSVGGPCGLQLDHHVHTVGCAARRSSVNTIRSQSRS